MKNSFITLEAADLQNCRTCRRNGIDPAFQSSTVTRIVMLVFKTLFYMGCATETRPMFILNTDTSSGETETYRGHPALENIRVTVTLLDSGAHLIKIPTWVAH